MSYLRLREIRSGETYELDLEFVRIGRDPDIELPISGEGAQVVSALHVELVFRDGHWSVEDLGSRNGTYLNGKKLPPGAPQQVEAGNVIGLGEGGPRFLVDAVRKRVLAQTMVEGPAASRASPSAATERMDAVDALGLPPMSAAPPVNRPAPPPPRVSPPPPPMAPPLPSPQPTAPPARSASPEPATAPPIAAVPRPAPAAVPAGPSMHLVAREVRSGRRFEARGGRVRIGRGDECELRPVAVGDTSVSRVHAEIVLKPDGTVVVLDAHSRNGTIVNGKPLAGEHRLVAGDHIVLGEGGPELEVDQVFGKSEAADPSGDSGTGPRRSFGGKGATLFVKDLLHETNKKSQDRLRWVVWTFVALLIVAAAVFYWLSERQGRRTDAAFEEQRRLMAAQQAAADTQRLAATQRYDSLRQALARAIEGAAPASEIERMRAELVAERVRTDEALQRAEASINRQTAAAEAAKRLNQAEVQRLQSALNNAAAGSGSTANIDSLRRDLAAAAQRMDSVNAQMRAIKGVNLAAIAQGNQAAVGLVTAFVDGRLYDASGFVITATGYFVTNRHAVVVEGRRADSIQVTMADQQFVKYADIIAIPNGLSPDVAVLKIRGYSGPHMKRIDWAGNGARQGEPAALIGFPAGVGAALDQTRTVRTSMSGGLFSQVTAGEIRFDGFTVGGSSGSPVFNADGEVVAIHRAGLREAAGLSFAVPIKDVIPLLPPDAKAELGIR